MSIILTAIVGTETKSGLESTLTLMTSRVGLMIGSSKMIGWMHSWRYVGVSVSHDTCATIGELRVGRFRFCVGSRASSPNEVCGVGGLIGAQNVQYEIFCRL